MGELGNEQAAFCSALLDELVRGGMSELVVCPGSRSAPLALAAARTEGLTLHVRLDERGAGFFAIGRSLVSGAPVGVLTTSGTAAAELTASVVEADLARVPLLALTADRPPELRGVGASQTINQVRLFGDAVRRFEDPGVVRPGTARTARPLAARVLGAATGVHPGPVHVNLAFVEPLDAMPGETPEGRADGRAWRVTHRVAAPAIADAALSSRRVLVVAGRGTDDADGVLRAALRLGWPVLADPLSGCRSDAPCSVAGFDPVLRDPALRGALAPEAIVQLGAPPASKALAEAVAGWGVRVIAVDPAGRAADPLGVVSDVAVASAGEWLGAQELTAAPASWCRAWRDADDAVQATFDDLLATSLDEPSLARQMSRETAAPLVVASSMPVRDLEWFGARAPAGGVVLSNRGANGIDGVVSTTLGVAAGSAAIGLLGDLAFLHDAGALADGLGRAGGSCVLVVADNRGGGIFSFLPQRGSVPHDQFEELFATPPVADVARVAAGYGCKVTEAGSLEEVAAATRAGLRERGVRVVVCRMPDRDANVARHIDVLGRAAAAARAAIGA